MSGRKAAYRFFAPAESEENACSGDDLDESDVWGFASDSWSSDHSKQVLAVPSFRKKTEIGSGGMAAASLPVNIPEWSKILKVQDSDVANSVNAHMDGGDDDDEGTGPVIPPHELLWRSRGASFSVHEGIGRTLKGRDLSRVRDAVWQRTGFED
ncbi:hypothetical protein HPP92_004790 [Vanilla planifolia]|uniref:Senescence regulator n=1 Tax=Vanilla planifolia TaxID=51239 RepID=A0A835RMY3_VANPL|nr:hypothetical protein HPP92_005144 [Vanilla planifolia]KAG0493796.1 hypothetical protein HPP92_004790 [Vanilla planifolia]